MRSGRDFDRELADVECWSASTERLFRETGAPAEDVVLQNRAELAALCRWIEAEGIRSYLEIGVWTGRLVSTLHRLFDFDRVAAADIGWARHLGLQIRVPFGCAWFEGDSRSAAFAEWRAGLGPVDLVLIDGDHSYAGVKADFEMQRRQPHQWLAFHDITGAHPSTAGVRRLWAELEGQKVELKRPNPDLGEAVSSMGIGLWRAG